MVTLLLIIKMSKNQLKKKVFGLPESKLLNMMTPFCNHLMSTCKSPITNPRSRTSSKILTSTYTPKTASASLKV